MTAAWSAPLAGALASLAIAAAARAVPAGIHPTRLGEPAPPVRAFHAEGLGAATRGHGRHGGRQERWRPAALAGLVAVAVLTTPALALLIMAGGWFAVQRARRRVQQRHRRQIATGLPDLVDLLLLCTSAGLAMPVAQASVAARTDGALGAALRAADQAAQAGRPRADCLIEALAPLGDPAARLAHVIADHLRYGVPLAPGLERLGAELKLERRRRAEEDARRVPVRLLGPLVACVLPAFGLLTVVPLLAASLRALPT